MNRSKENHRSEGEVGREDLGPSEDAVKERKCRIGKDIGKVDQKSADTWRKRSNNFCSVSPHF